MSEKTNWMFKVQVLGGPNVTANKDVELETYVKSSVKVANGTPVEVAFVASPSLLIVSADKYTDAALVVTYTINAAAAVKKLDGPLVLIGKENVKLLDAAVTKLTFTNPFPTDIQIELLSGNDV
jgi:hypothetical protein